MLENYYRNEIPKQKLFEQVAGDVYVSDPRLWQIWKDTHDSAQVSYVAYRPETIPDSGIQVSDADVRKFYDANKKDFDRPGRAVVSFVKLPRTVTAVDSAAVRSKIVELRNEIVGGAKFEDVAKRESADSGSAVQGGSLGKTTRGRLVPEFEKVAFALKPGELSQPVLTQFGYHLIKLDSRAGDTLNLRHILLRIEPSDSSAAKVDREADQLSKLAASSDQPAKFDEAARTLKLTPFRVPVTEGEPAQYNGRYVPSVSAWAFGGAKLGETSDLFDAEDGYYLARLDTLTVGGKTFDAVKSEVRHRVALSRAVERLVPSAQALAQAARTSTLEAAAAAKGLTVAKTGMTTRAGAAQLFGSLGEAVGAAFALPANTLSTPIRQDDGVFVMHVDARKPAARAAFEAQKNDLRTRRLQQLRTQRVQMFLDDLRKSAKLTDKRKDISAQIRRQATT